ncbi:hypothetical protein ACFQ0X_41895 [Streptomyces rectiviolaceus]|uniref:Ferredoxin n=1 Tax=Streptomyces rectiviolaceus TaxID=332591 RepID=A0ABP6N1Y5_9ACTN
MLQGRELFDSHASRADHLDNQAPATAADALSACEQAVTACAVGMLAEKVADELRAAVNRDRNCADVASATRCVMACEHGHELRARHAPQHEHCRLYSEATDSAAAACREVLRSLRALGVGPRSVGRPGVPGEQFAQHGLELVSCDGRVREERL